MALLVKNVLYPPNLDSNLLSVTYTAPKGYGVGFVDGGCSVTGTIGDSLLKDQSLNLDFSECIT